MTDIYKAAIELAKAGIPSFPTHNKRPSWTNDELELGVGEGGFKVATTKRPKLKKLFAHERATELAVPMGDMSGLMCIDVDLYKTPGLQQWVDDNEAMLKGAVVHETRSGGLHFIFQHPGDRVRSWPKELTAGVDVKAGGNGYICYPPTKGYKRISHRRDAGPPPDLLIEMLNYVGSAEASRRPNGSGGGSIDPEQAIENIKTADDFHGSLTALSYHYSGLGGARATMAKDDLIEALHSVMDESVAREVGHGRHKRWNEAKAAIERNVERDYKLLDDRRARSERHRTMEVFTTPHSPADVSVALSGPPIRPIGPQRNPTMQQVERSVAALEAALGAGDDEEDDEEEPDPWEVIDLNELRGEKLAPIDWLIPQMIPEMGTVSLGGTSNVGKTRWLCALSVGVATGSTEGLGLPPINQAAPVLWVANEERASDIRRRVKAVLLQHPDLVGSAPIVVRGKDRGSLRIVALNEVGNPEIDVEAVADIIRAARSVGAKLIILDPYITLSDAGDENDAGSAALLSAAMLLIASGTGAAVLHAHHTPKDRSKDADWYRADAGAWRGSGAIYSALDCGFTLAPYIPKEPALRKAWKQRFLSSDLGRWVVLDTGKIREGRPLEPVLYEMVGQEMGEGEGDPIGVMRLSDERMAGRAIRGATSGDIVRRAAADLIASVIPDGKVVALPAVHKALVANEEWLGHGKKTLTTHDHKKLEQLFDEPVPTGRGLLEYRINESGGKTKRAFRLTPKQESTDDTETN